MAYATKYLFKWESVNGTTREIRVLLDGYSGSVIQRRLGRAPVLKKQNNGNVYGTSLEFYAECAVDGEFAEFYTTDPKAYRVDLYSGNTLLWQGYITPELYAEPDIAPPYDVQVIATDGVGELKLYDFAPQGLVSLRSMLTYLLGYTGLTTDVYLISSIKPGGSGAAGSLLEKTINLDYMAGESCYEVLSYILDTLHATITWWKGAWILARETNVKFSSGKVQYFNTSGNAGTLAGSVVTLGKMYTNDAWPVGQLSSKIDPAKNSVRIQAPWHPVTALSNPDMTSDTGWTKAGGVVYDSTNKGYHLPEASLSAIPRISQTLSLSSLKNPMTLAAKVTGVSADLSLSTLFTAAMGFYVTYEVSGTTYHLERSDEGLVWKQGAMPSLLNYTNTIFTFLKTFDEDRTGAQTVDIEIPPFLLNNAFPAGTLAVYVFGGCVRVYGASLDVIISKGYQDNLYLDNDARGEGGEVEIAIGRETSAISPYQAFLQGILLDSGSLITSFKDDYITSSGLDFMSFIARDYARSFALPRIVQAGTVSLESSVTFPPLVFTKGALDYWLEGYSWNMLDDELDISARSLPTATITVDSETVTEAGGTASSAAQGGSSSGGGSMPSGVNYFQIDEDLATLIQPKPQFDFLSPKKGLIFETTEEADVASSPAHLMLRNLGTAQEPNYALYTPYALITGGDQIVGSGTPGGGGGGAGYLYELGDIYHDTDKTKVLRDPDYAATPGQQAQPGDVLVLDSTYGWAAVPSASIGGVTSVVGQTGDVTANQISTAIGLGNYLPKSGGSMSGPITFELGSYMALRRTSGGTPETFFSFDGTSQILGPTVGTTTIRSGYASLYHYRGNTSYEIYTAHNLTKSVLTGLLEGSDGYYVKKSGDTMSGSITFSSTSGSTGLFGVGGGSGTGWLFYDVSGTTITTTLGMEPSSLYTSTSIRLRTKTYTNIQHIVGSSTYTMYDSGNSNKSDVAWTCSTLTASGQIHLYTGNSANYGYIKQTDAASNISRLILGSCYGYNSPVDAVTIMNGNVGIGIGDTSPAYKLDVNAASGWASVVTSGARSRVYLANDSGYGISVHSTTTTASTFLFKSVYGQTTLGTGGSIALFVGGNGNVGVGTETPVAKFTVVGDISLYNSTGGDTPRLIFQRGNLHEAGGFDWSMYASSGNLYVDVTLSSAGWQHAAYFGYASKEFVTIGDQVISSDATLKTNFKDITYTVKEVAEAPAVTFDRKDTKAHSFGSIAQYWLPICREMVHGEKEGEYTIAYAQGAFVNSIINARAIVDLQGHETEQDKEIRKLREKVQKLEEDNLRLKARLGLEN